MALEWSDLKVLLALARAGSVVGAARDLQVDHSTISRRLAALEDAHRRSRPAASSRCRWRPPSCRP
jgi:DNA-binding transcriptional LysR family regulator